MRFIELYWNYVKFITLTLFIIIFSIRSLTQEKYHVIATLQSQEPEINAGFGLSLAASRDIVIVGEPSANVKFIDEGRAYIFNSDGNLLTTLQSLKQGRNTEFGMAVAVSGDIVVIGGYGPDIGGTRMTGKAYIIDSEGNLLTTLCSPKRGKNAGFGTAVAVSGDLVVVGEKFADVGDIGRAGRAYIFDSDGSLIKSLQAPEPDVQGRFGWCVAVSGDIVVVGENTADVGSISRAGRAYIFDSDGNLIKSIQAPEPEANAWFGMSIAVGRDIVAIGEPNANVKGVRDAGKTHIFDTNGNYLTSLQAPIPQAFASFYCVAIYENIIIIGEPGANVDGLYKAGRAYIFGVSTRTLSAPKPRNILEFPPKALALGLVISLFLGSGIYSNARTSRSSLALECSAFS